MNSAKQLAVAFHLYAGDFDDLYPPNPDDHNTIAGHNWCAGDAGVNGAQQFDPDILRDPEKTLVSPYISGNVGVFKCPADTRNGIYQGSNPSMTGKTVPAARSVALNHGVGSVCGQFVASGSGHSGKPAAPTNGPWLTGSHGGNKHDHPWATFGKSTKFNKVSASQVFLMVDESTWSINDGVLAVSAGTAEWVDFPATFHNNACGFSFCDGHAEVHKWRGTSMQSNAPASGQRPVAASDQDWNWIATHATIRVN